MRVTPTRKNEDRIEDLIRTARADAERLGAPAGPGSSTDSRGYAAGSLPAGVLPADFVPGYELLRELHRGGQGVVYQALQVSTGKLVAIKVLRAGQFASRNERIRFEREMQILAEFDDPQIVAIRDRGEACGLDYVITDYVNGVHLDAYVRAAELGIRGVLRLFMRVCDAVNAAHLRGVIHRDLKPANILVDKAGLPRILDFGLAKTVGAGPGSTTLTQEGLFLGSLPWASAEQAAGAQSKIDVRTDVYSLGAILYELLTGRPPHDAAGPLPAVLARIENDAPASPRTIRRDIDDEVQTIILKCLSKERERRYQSARELREDVERYLAGQPIEAKRDSLAYVARKFVRRHWLPLSLTGAAVVGIVAAVLLALDSQRQAQQAAEAQARAEDEVLASSEIQRVMDDVRLARDAVESRQERDLAEIQALDFQVGRIDIELAEEPVADYRVRNVVAGSYLQLGQFEKSNEQWHQALRAAEGGFGPDSEPAIAALNGIGETYQRLGRHELAIQSYFRVRDIRRRCSSPDSLEVADVLGRIAGCLCDSGDAASGIPFARESLRISLLHFSEYDYPAYAAYKGVGEILCDAGKLEEAERYKKKALDLAVSAGDSEELVSHFLHSYGVTLRKLGRLDEAEGVLRSALEIRERVYPPQHRWHYYQQVTQAALAQTLALQQRFAEAEQLLLRAEAEYKPPPSGDLHRIRWDLLSWLVGLYEEWDVVEGGHRHAVEVARWRATLEAEAPVDYTPRP